ncbi:MULTISPECIES: hypothetical protein [unclassified Polaribacter]|uniref:hypothetical protein n=1 Tax=unclassified Polaribacter TaxID=196858 RepID=UPI0011BF12E5|nr:MULTISPECIES: hypothetical protein [unclassified Polaribacter]TXD52955.1 hypothetical protein ES043_06145 [Polaribacter sp. IC063]TXD60954.1 hypothetical protein ES044_06320 [Polaribacter sp. IC066]
MMKNILFFCFIVLLTNSTISQTTKFSDIDAYPQEKIYLHTNTNFFLTGETVLYKIYCRDIASNTMSSLSKVGYVELINQENNSISKQKIRLKNGLGNGAIFLSSSLKTGTYKIISYTQWMRNKQIFFEENIFIINPFSAKLTASDTLKKNNFKKEFVKTTTYLKLASNKKVYQKRELVTLTFDGHISKTMSLSVRKQDSILIPTKINAVAFEQNFKPSRIRSKKEYLPELRGSLYQGSITSKTNKSVLNKKIGLSFIGENKITKISITDATGIFFFNIDAAYDASNVRIQVLEKDKKNYTISLIDTHKLEKKFDNFDELLLTENIRKLIKKRSFYTQIENAYIEVKQPTYPFIKNNKAIFHHNKNKVVYILDEYTRFKTVKEVTVEILKDVWISKEKEEYCFNIRDVNLESNTTLKTLLIVDGFLVDNHNDFVFFDALKIKSIALIKEKYYFGAKNYHGIINIITFKNDYKPNVNSKNQFLLLKPIEEKITFSPDYRENINKQIPDFRTQLFWGSNFNLTAEKTSFYTSDQTGTFEAIIEGFTKEGIAIYEKITFSVQ